MPAIKRIRDTADAAWQSLRSRDIVPTPRNFELWFACLSDENPKLRARIETLTSAGEPLTQALLDELYREFCDAMLDVGPIVDGTRELGHIAGSLATKLGGERGMLEAFSDLLDGWRPRAAVGADPDTDRRAVAALQTATIETGDRLRALEHLLAASATRIGELKQELARAERDAARDPLTGLGNRRMFDSMLARAADGAVRESADLSLLLLDIDHFKTFNDTYGHQMGDNVLRLLARTLTEHIEGRDTAARYGGEEFAIILAGVGLEPAEIVGNRIRGLLERRPIVNRSTGQQLGIVTCSIGAALYRHGEPLSELVRRADEALYMAKRSGRNRVCAEAA